MTDVVLSLTDVERREIQAIARHRGEVVGDFKPVSLDEMALALLQAHLILVRDCGGVLPAVDSAPIAAPDAVGGKFSGKGGVSLSSGPNAD